MAVAPTVILGFLVATVVAAIALSGTRHLRAMMWGGRLPWRLGALPVEEVAAEEAPRAWKCCRLLTSPAGDGVRLAGVAIGGAYAAEDTAVCVLGRGHTPPALSCECGFYAFADRADAARMLACRLGYDGNVVVQALSEVDLSGTVIECDRGYRAERQRVLSVALLPWCADCGADGDLVAAERLGTETWHVRKQVAIPPVEPDAGRLHQSVRVAREWLPLRPLCGDCAAQMEGAGVTFDLLDVAGSIGTEVRWLGRQAVPTDRVLAGYRPRRRWDAGPPAQPGTGRR